VPTTTVKTIGATGADYTTIAAWLAACPANLVSNDEIWQGQLKNQEFDLGGTVVSATGITCDATRYLELIPQSGAGFRDQGSFATNALRYNASNGAAVKIASNYTPAFRSGTGVVFRLNGLQVKNTGNAAVVDFGPALGGGGSVEKCIIEGVQLSVSLSGAGASVANSVCTTNSSSGSGIAQLAASSSAYNTLFANMAASANAAAIYGNYGTGVAKNCGFFGSTLVKAAGNAVTITSSFTDVASPPSGCTTTAYATATGAKFTNKTSGSQDWRPQSGSSLIAAGTADTTNAPVSINAITRTAGAGNSTVGPWEFVSPAANVTMSGPSSGAVGAASTNFSIGADGTITGTVVVTPSDGGGGGSFTPTSVSISVGAPTGTFTYTPATAGAKTISVTNDGGLGNPTNITYTATGGADSPPVINLALRMGVRAFGVRR
jgi:hypothetical protein